LNIKHENYTSTFTGNDIALLILENEIELTNQIQTACLPSKTSSLVANTTVFIAGWGSTQSYSNGQTPQPPPIYPNILQNLKIGILPYTNCESVLSLGFNETLNLTINDSLQICAGKLN